MIDRLTRQEIATELRALAKRVEAGKPEEPEKPPAPPAWDPGSANGKLAPPGFTPKRPIPNSARYDLKYPTRFMWREDVQQVVRNLYKKFGKYNIFVNTYVSHPAEASPPRPNVSLDVWGGGGDRPGWRGLWLPASLGAEVWHFLYDDPKPPNIRWIIYHRTIRGVWSGFAPEPFGDGSRFTNHDDHIHVTYDGPFQQIS